MSMTDVGFMKSFIRLCDDGWQQGWHERNGGNLSYRLKDEDVDDIKKYLKPEGWESIGVSVPELKGEYFAVTGTGKYFRNAGSDSENFMGIIEVDESGDRYRKCWGLSHGSKPTSELPTHLLNHQVNKVTTNGLHRVIYHAHPANVIALTFVLPLEDKAFTREIWETMTECPLIFPEGIGVVPWMVPGGKEIGIATAELMKNYSVVVWTHHGLFCSGEDFDLAFGLMHTVEKAAEILVKVYSIGQGRRQTITTEGFRKLAEVNGVALPERFLQ